MAFTKEQVADFLAEKTLKYFDNPHDTINPYQKGISGGNININRDPNNPLIVYKYDIKANIEEYAAIVINESIGEDSTYSAWATPDGDISSISSVADFENFRDTYLISPENIGQFVEFETSQSIIDPFLAGEVLDTGIYELLPQQSNRQSDINKFFDDFEKLTNNAPSFDEDPDGSGIYVLNSNWDDISYSPYDPNASIVRLNENAGENNQGQTLEWLRNTLDTYLEDVDSIPVNELLDDRPEYENVSDGYLKIRGLNQSILIRQEEGKQIDFAGVDSGGLPNYLNDGFTITMWVRFLNKVNSGTLFNFGNPFRSLDPHGFKLETFILKNGDVDDASGAFFTDTEYERFIRLVVRENSSTLKDSLMIRDSGNNEVKSIDEMISDSDNRVYGFTHVPVDLTEWYFIVANYNVDILETYDAEYNNNPYYWKWNMTNAGEYTSYSGLGAKCKVEIISRSDLLRARGFKS